MKKRMAKRISVLLSVFLILGACLSVAAYRAAGCFDLFGDSAVGEYFRAFLSYGVIAVALIMYAWRGAKQKKEGQMSLSDRGKSGD